MTWDNVEIATRPMTTEEVFAVLARLYVPLFDPNDPDSDIARHWTLTPEMTVNACLSEIYDPWSSCRYLGRQLNEAFGIDFSQSEWERVLKPKRKKTVRELCEAIAEVARVPEVSPVSILGSECVPGGAFLTIRALLAKAGANVTALRPSSPLEPYLRKHRDFVWELVKLAPARVPPLVPYLTIQRLVPGLILMVSLCGMCLTSVLEDRLSPGLFYGKLAFGVAAFLSLVACCVVRCLSPSRMRLGHLRTFRDLSYVIADQEASKTDA